jgi:hypothetical protein
MGDQALCSPFNIKNATGGRTETCFGSEYRNETIKIINDDFCLLFSLFFILWFNPLPHCPLQGHLLTKA